MATALDHPGMTRHTAIRPDVGGDGGAGKGRRHASVGCRPHSDIALGAAVTATFSGALPTGSIAVGLVAGVVVLLCVTLAAMLI